MCDTKQKFIFDDSLCQKHLWVNKCNIVVFLSNMKVKFCRWRKGSGRNRIERHTYGKYWPESLYLRKYRLFNICDEKYQVTCYATCLGQRNKKKKTIIKRAWRFALWQGSTNQRFHLICIINNAGDPIRSLVVISYFDYTTTVSLMPDIGNFWGATGYLDIFNL